MTVGTITGDREVMRALAEIGIKKAKNIIRGSLRAQAIDAKKRVKANAPKHPVDVYKKEDKGIDKVTKKGTLKRAIIAKERKPRGNRFNAVVRITEGQNAKQDAYFWKYIEHGTIKQPAQPFIKPVEDVKKITTEQELKAEFLARVEAALQASVQ